MTVDRDSSLLHPESHDLDHIQELAHGRIPVVLQREIVIVNCNRSERTCRSEALNETFPPPAGGKGFHGCQSTAPGNFSFPPHRYSDDFAALHVPASSIWEPDTELHAQGQNNPLARLNFILKQLLFPYAADRRHSVVYHRHSILDWSSILFSTRG